MLRMWCALVVALAALVGSAEDMKAAEARAPVVLEKIEVDTIWPAVRVGYALLTHGDVQYLAYYNSGRRMVVAMRRLREPTFTKKVLSSHSEKPPTRKTSSTVQGWDSHNSITLAVDAEGHLHLAGNMHANPLTYFRAGKPDDVMSMVQVDAMVGRNEARCTYPKLMHLEDGTLLFHYRDGGSGNGVEIFNAYDTEAKTWRRFFDKPLISGEGKRNAYQNGPRRGPDGWYHNLWVWRMTPDAATNHDLSYARSRDMLRWETAAGEPLSLPILHAHTKALVDPIPVEGGIINGCQKYGFDRSNRIVVSYHKHDAEGNTQAYVARFDAGAWTLQQVSDWSDRHIFKGGGSGPSTFGTSLRLGSVVQHDTGRLALSFSHWKAGRGLLVFDEATLKPLGVEPHKPGPARHPKELSRPQSKFPGMQVRWRGDSGTAPEGMGRYAMRWETLGSNRDRPRKGDLPQPGPLVLYRLGAK